VEEEHLDLQCVRATVPSLREVVRLLANTRSSETGARPTPTPATPHNLACPLRSCSVLAGTVLLLDIEDSQNLSQASFPHPSPSLIPMNY
jgi:hypothetical protein